MTGTTHYIAVTERKGTPRATRFQATIRQRKIQTVACDTNTKAPRYTDWVVDTNTGRCTVFAETHAHAEFVAANIARIEGIELGDDPLG